MFPSGSTTTSRLLSSAVRLGILACLALLEHELSAADRANPAPAVSYHEPFRPQFHFTPERNWMNDPNGMVFHAGVYHLFYQYNPYGDKWGHMSWGHATSRDLVHWSHQPVALLEEGGVMIFSGSAVVDGNNTSGLGIGGRPPLVAIYTGHYTEKPLQNQHLASSSDGGTTWTKFPGNPVLDLGEKDFRDPKVFWHEPTKRWIMVVAWPLHRQVRFYASPDLKTWSHLSDFGPAGSTIGIWECPDLFPLPVEGRGQRRAASNPNRSADNPVRRGGIPADAAGMRRTGANRAQPPTIREEKGGLMQPRGQRTQWVLVVNVGGGAVAGGSGTQYFVGDFDGTRFTELVGTRPPATPEVIPGGGVFADFEGADYAGWQAEGDAFRGGPSRTPEAGQPPSDGRVGRGIASSFGRGDADQGTLTSPPFVLGLTYVNFLIGGGAHPGETCMNLVLLDGTVVRTATGRNSGHLTWHTWDVSDLRGRGARLQIVDRHAGDWGQVLVDHIRFSNAPARPAAESALWADYGRDFYAAVSWSDIPKSDGRRIWLGWMSNWEYAQDVPTSPWRSAMSLPRELRLRETSQGLRLVQKPVRELTRLRGPKSRFQGGTAEEANRWLRRHAIRGDQLELRLELPARNFPRGLRVLKGPQEHTQIRVDTQAGLVRVDRTRSGAVGFHSLFPDAHQSPLLDPVRPVTLHVFVDTSSVEVFVNDGEQVLTQLVFPSSESREVECFAAHPKARFGPLEVWPLRSIWK